MQYYIRELHDKRALLIAEDGYPLSTFDSVTDAVSGCIIHCRVAPIWIEWYGDDGTGRVADVTRYRRATDIFPPLAMAS